MKSKFILTLIGLVTSLIIVPSASADILLSVGNGTFTQNSGVQTVDIFVSSNAADTSLFLTADFQLEAGVFPPTAGVFGQSGMVGAGNIQSPPASQFVSTGNNLSTLSLDFNNPQSFPSTNTLLARMFIDTTGLALGTYNIQVTSFATQAISSSNNGTFTITTVPEPSSLCLLGIMPLWALGRRLKSRKAKARS